MPDFLYGFVKSATNISPRLAHHLASTALDDKTAVVAVQAEREYLWNGSDNCLFHRRKIATICRDGNICLLLFFEMVSRRHMSATLALRAPDLTSLSLHKLGRTAEASEHVDNETARRPKNSLID